MKSFIQPQARTNDNTLNGALKSAAVSVALALSFALAPVATAQADEMDASQVVVFKDQAKVFRLSQPASTIIVGNPQLLAATVQDLQTIVLTGKGYGTTNMIILNDAGEPILDETVVISANGHAKVYVYSQSAVSTLSCTSGACYAETADNSN